MPIYEIEDAQGRKLELEGDHEPTPQELENIFSQTFPVAKQESASQAPYTTGWGYSGMKPPEVYKGSIGEMFEPFPGVREALDVSAELAPMRMLTKGTRLESAQQAGAEAVKEAAASVLSPGGAIMAVAAPVAPALVGAAGAAMSAPGIAEGAKEAAAGVSERDLARTVGGATKLGVAGLATLAGAAAAVKYLPRAAKMLESEIPLLEPKQISETVKPEPSKPSVPVSPPVEATTTPPVTSTVPPPAVPTEASPVPATPLPESALTGIKNARVDAQRKARGLEPLMEPARKSDAALWDSAMAKIDADPRLPDRLVKELTDNPRPMTDEEAVIVEHRMVELTNDLSEAREAGIRAADAGDAAQAAEMEARAGEISDALSAVEQAVGRENEAGVGAGTLMGRAFRARQFLMNEDFSYGGLDRMKREANGFKPLDPAQSTDVAETAKTFKELTEKIQARLKKRVQVYEEKLAKGDYTRKPKPELPDDPEINRLSLQLDKLKRRWFEGLVNDKMRRQTAVQRAGRGFVESLNAMRAILTSVDFSALLRQGKFIALAHPVRAAKSVPAMVKSMFSEQAAFDVNRSIEQSPNYRLMRASKLYLAEHGAQLSKMEEAYMSRWASKIPGIGRAVRGSERAYTTFLNKLRADSFDAMTETLGRNGKVTPEQGRIVANFINVATGRGTIGMADQAAVGLNTFFFAPRFVASRFQMLLGQPLYYGLLSGKAPFAGKGALAARALVAREYGRIIGGAATVYGLGRLAGAEIETDPRSSDFGKMRWGHTRIDPMAGLNQITVLLSRLTTGETKLLQNAHIVPLRRQGREPLRYGSQTTGDVIARFVRLKLAPAPGLALDVITGTDAVGEPTTASSIAKDSLVPISLQDIATQMKEEGWPQNVIFSTLAIFGESVQNFDETKRRR